MSRKLHNVFTKLTRLNSVETFNLSVIINECLRNRHRLRTLSRFKCSIFLVVAIFSVLLLNPIHAQDYPRSPNTYSSFPFYSSPSTEAYTKPIEVVVTETHGGIITDGHRVLSRNKSPYLLREDLIVDRMAELIIEAGVEIRVGPMVGITVRGVLTAVGTSEDHITLTSAQEPMDGQLIEPSLLRLVDGPSVLAGRLQIFHGGAWRSVCTNSRNWTTTDIDIACRQLGYKGGRFYNWIDREMPLKPRLLYEEPQCSGTENNLFDCKWSTRQLGSGVCDYHPDLGIECFPRHENTLKTTNYWRGVRFENAQHENILTSNNILYVPISRSKIQFVDIKYAGSGRDYNTTSALDIHGVPPVIQNVQIVNSAYNGINLTAPNSPIDIQNCTIRNNRGYGIFINSSYGLAHIEGSMISENGGDGIKYVHQEERPDEKLDRSDISDFCTFPTTASQTFPIQIVAEQSYHSKQDKICIKDFYTRNGYVLTLSFIRMETDRNNSASIEVYDGTSPNDKLLGMFPIRNNTRAQSITTTRNRISIKFRAERNSQMFIFMKLTAGLSKHYDFNVTSSTIADNNGRGIAVENLRSQIHIHKSSISNNNHVAGLHVLSGVGDINVTDSRIAFNKGDGINITYTGGNRNISRCSISSNKGYGIAVWLNDTKETEYIAFNQTSVVEYSEIFKNVDTGVLHGNFCGNSYINITENKFTDSLKNALEISSCWKTTNDLTNLLIAYNFFIGSNRLGIKIKPALNMIARIQYNHFINGTYGAILIKNQLFEEFTPHKTDIFMNYNEFYANKGIFVVNLGLSPYSANQRLIFTRNFVKNNRISEPFELEDGIKSRLIPRSRVAAPVVVSSENVDIFRNIIHNRESNYEVGSHFEDQSKQINCTYNWLGFTEESKIFYRLFDRKDRYNLAKIVYLPFLLHSSNPGATTIIEYATFVPQFNRADSNSVGGEVDGLESLPKGSYIVERDINVRPGGKLILQAGVTLSFPPSIGMMIAGKLDARGRGPNDILFTLREEIVPVYENETYEIDTEHYNSDTEIIEIESKIPVRLLGGKSPHEGRLQVKINNEWGTVCSYGWTMLDAALVCHQLGLVLNPDDWLLERNEIPAAGITEKIILSNVDCDEEDIDIVKCKSEKEPHFENSCTHEQDVGLKCYESSWAGLRFSGVAERSDLQYITIEKAGLLDYATNYFKPALQIDFAKHSLESIKVNNNYQDGLGVIYSDIYSQDAINVIKNSEFSYNRGNGISFKQLGMKIQGTLIEHNLKSGIRHNSAISGIQQRELAGWFNMDISDSNYKPIFIPQERPNIGLEVGETKYLLSAKVVTDSVRRKYNIKCKHGYVIGIQLLSPIQNRSTETIYIYDSPTDNSLATVWSVGRDINVFPTTSSSYGVIMEYDSGINAEGGTVIALTAVPAPIQNIRNKIVKGPVSTLNLYNTKIRRNKQGIKASYYNRYLDENNNHYLRKANETFKIIDCEISHNSEDAIFLHSPYWDIHESNMSEVLIMINNSLITDNGRGIHHFSRDMRDSNNLFHYVLKDNSIERNLAGGLELSLPYVWAYNENFTHSIYLYNNTWRDNTNFAVIIDGHFAAINITKNVFSENSCKNGLISFRGMEKKLKINENKIFRNTGKYMVQFKSDSQSEIMGNVFAIFVLNEVKENSIDPVITRGISIEHLYYEPTSVIDFNGIQKVKVVRNLFGGNKLEYELVAGIRTARVDNILDVRENWWGTNNPIEIKKKIFDFDDWNNHAIAQFRPFLTENSFESSHSITWEASTVIDLDNIGGRLTQDLILYPRAEPYVIYSDITVMPSTTLTISPGVEMEFASNVGILVLGTIRARGLRNQPIIMRPISRKKTITKSHKTERLTQVKRSVENVILGENIRLCTGKNCSDITNDDNTNEGFLEYYNSTTLQWIPICDNRFTERNAQVVCRQLGFDPINVYFDHDIRIEYHSNSLSRIWSWPEPLECKGTEGRYEDCPIRLNGQLYGHRHMCEWNDQFVFIHCGERNLNLKYDYWGGIRIADSDFEQRIYEHRIHDIHTHETVRRIESIIEFVNITGAGVLHNEKSPAILSIVKSPTINFVNITNCASHGINLISPSNTMRLLFNNIHNTLGIGINALSLTGEGREAAESSFAPLKDLDIPYHLFSLIDICDTTKEILMEERVILYYKYDNSPVNCVKIFKSSFNVKPFGFRLLQFNLFNSSSSPAKPDSIELYDGDIYNISSTLIKKIEVGSNADKTFFKTKEPRLSVKLFANGASSNHGFIAEIVTLPISAIGFNRDVQHNITHCEITNNRNGAIQYSSVGEVNPIITMEKNHFSKNCVKLYGNFTTCKGAINLDVQNTQTLYFRNNLVKSNQGGLFIKADSRGSATSLKGWIHNNLFVINHNLPALYIEGRQSSPYQEVTIYRNYFSKNNAPYENIIVLRQVVSNFTHNFVHDNVGAHIFEVSGFDTVRWPVYQSTSHNGFYGNHALERDSKSTVVAGAAGQQYVDNIFYNPDNDYEMVSLNRSIFVWNSSLDMWSTKIDASHNYWGYNDTIAVSGRIKDLLDDINLLEVTFEPFYMNNNSVLNGKCPPGWDLVGDTCYMYVGAPMTFFEARDFCRSDNASMPYVMGKYLDLYKFLRKQNEWYQYSDRVWVQHIDKINKCTLFTYQTIEIDNCEQKNPFLCEIDPKIVIDPLSWRQDIVAIAVISSLAGALLLLIAAVACWCGKNKHRREQRLQRRNSIRQSLHSLRSVGSHHSFNEFGYRRGKPLHMSSRSTDTLTKNSDYKKMVNNGSIDSMDKSALNSSIDDNQSYDIYEAHNPNLAGYSNYSTPSEYTSPTSTKPNQNTPFIAKPNTFDLAYKNEGFRDNSTFASQNNSNFQSRSESIQDTWTPSEDTPIIHSQEGAYGGYPPNEYYNTDTLPLNHSIGKSDSTLDYKTGLDDTLPMDEIPYGTAYVSEKLPLNFLEELKYKMPSYNNENDYSVKPATFGQKNIDLPPKPPSPPISYHQNGLPYSPNYDEKIENLQYTPDSYNQLGIGGTPPEPYFQNQNRPKSAALLETDVDNSPTRMPKSKSEVLLETNLDYLEPNHDSAMLQPLSVSNRSKSQPLETSM